MRMEEKSKLALIFVLVFFAVFFLARQVILPIDSREIPTEVLFSNRSGFDLSDGKLSFGMVTAGQNAIRVINIENPFERRVFVKISSSGNISKGLIVSRNNFFLEPLEKTTVSFSVYADKLGEEGFYSGVLRLDFFRDFFRR